MRFAIVRLLIIAGEVAIVGVLRLREFCLPHIKRIFIDLFLLHHGRHSLILIKGDAVEVAGLSLVLCILLCDDFDQSISGNQGTFSYEFIEKIYGELFFAFAVIVLQVILLPALALLHKVEQLQHAVILPYLLQHLLMLEVHLSVFLQPIVEVLQLIIQFYLCLDQRTDEDQNELYFILAANLLDFDATEILHSLTVHCTLVDAVAQNIDADIRRQQDDQIRGQFKRFEDYLIQCRLKVSNGDVLIAGQMKLCQLWLREHHIHTLSHHPQKSILMQLNIGIHLIHLGIIQQKPHFLLILLTSNHLLAGVHIGQFNGIPTYACKRVQDYLSAVAFIGDVLGNLLRRVDGP